MKNLNTKSLMVITIVIASVFTMPMAVMGQEKESNDTFNLDQVNAGLFTGFQGGFGAIFSNNLGYARQILGSVSRGFLCRRRMSASSGTVVPTRASATGILNGLQ